MRRQRRTYEAPAGGPPFVKARPLVALLCLGAWAASLIAPDTSHAAYYQLGAFWRKPSQATGAPPTARLISIANDGGTPSAGMTGNQFQLSTTGVNDGDYLLVFGCSDNNSDPWPDPFVSGFTQLSQDIFGNDGQECFGAWKIAQSEPATYTGNYASGTNYTVLALIAVSGADSIGTPTLTIQTGSAAQPVIGNSTGVTTDFPNSLIVYASGTDWECSPGTSVFTAPSGYTQLTGVGDHGDTSWDWSSLQIAVKTQAAAGASGAIAGSQSGPSCGGLAWTLAVALSPAGSVPDPTKLAITSAPQTLATTWSCSGALNIQAQDATGHAASPKTSPLTVSLSGTGVTYFSDSSCTQPVTSYQIPNGSSAAHTVYFEGTTSGTAVVNASTTGLTSATQNETIGALIPFTWIGGGGCNGAWATASCWQGGNIPSSGDTAHFDANCSSNCSATLGADADVGGLVLHPGSVDTLNLNGHVLEAGTAFIGGGTANLNGTLWIDADYAMTGGTINAAGSTLRFEDPTCWFSTLDRHITPGTATYNNVTFSDSDTCGPRRRILSGGMTVNGILTLGGQNGGGILSGGAIFAKGNVVLLHDGYGADTSSGATTTVQLVGSSNQLVDASGTTLATLPALSIASTGGTVTFKGNVGVEGHYAYVSGTTDFASNDATLTFDGTYDCNFGGNHWSLSPGTIAYNRVTFADGSGCSQTSRFLDSGSTMTVNGTLTLDGQNGGVGVYSGTIAAKGDIVILHEGLESGVGPSSLVTIQVAGSSNQLVDASGTTTAYLPSFAIASTGGTVKFKGNPRVMGNYAYVSGTTDFTTFDSTLTFDGSPYCTFIATDWSITPGTIAYNRVTFADGNGCDGMNRNLDPGSTMTINGALTIAGSMDGGYITGGTISAAGDVTASSTAYTIFSNLTVGGNWINSSGSTFLFSDGTFTFTPGVSHTVSGNNTFFNFTMDDSGVTTADTLTLPAGKTQTISGTLNLSGNATNRLKIRSSTNGTQATITPSSSTTLGGFLDVKDSKRGGSSTLHTGASSIGPNTGACAPSQNDTNWVCP